MGKPAARVGDMHVCPMVTGLVPHVGGPVIGPGVPNVLIGGVPAATVGDMCACAGPPDSIIMGSTGVFIGGKPAARMGDICAHGGSIVIGLPTVMIGEVSAGSAAAGAPPAALAAAMQNMPPEVAKKVNQAVTMKKAADSGVPFCEKCEAAKNAATT